MRLVNQAGRALAEVNGADWDALGAQEQARLRQAVHAVIAALRDPDEVMAEAGAQIVRNVGPNESEEAHLSDAANTWRFMIDVLLGESR